MGFDLAGAFASITDSAKDAAIAQATAQAAGAYGTSVPVAPSTAPTKPAGALASSLPPETLATAQPGMLTRYWKWLALAGAVVALVVVMGRRKRK